MKSTKTLLLSGFLVLGFALPLQALEVYQWTDEDGVVHFSQWAPEGRHHEVETVSLEGTGEASNGLGISEEDDPEGYRAHREQMAALRAEMQARRESERERREQAAQTEVVYLQQENPYPYVYPPYGYRPPYKPDRPPPPRPQPLPGDGAEDPPTSTLRPLSQRRR